MKKYLPILIIFTASLFSYTIVCAQTATINTDLSKKSYNANTNNDSLYIHKPFFIDSGNKDLDRISYQTEKEKWIKNYPQEYNAWVKLYSVTNYKISSKEFKMMPKEKQENIMNNPEKYTIIENE